MKAKQFQEFGIDLILTVLKLKWAQQMVEKLGLNSSFAVDVDVDVGVLKLRSGLTKVNLEERLRERMSKVDRKRQILDKLSDPVQ